MPILPLILAPIALAVAAVSAGSVRWHARTRRLKAALQAPLGSASAAAVDLRALDGLPPPLQRYFQRVLNDGMPAVAAVRARHRGTFNMGGAAPDWKPFTSTQLVVTARPGFVWDGKVAVAPGIAARVHDAYVAGDGVLHAALLGLVTVARMEGGGEVARGELMRFLAEAAWYPTALLPGHGVVWSPVDAHSAKATLTDGPNSVTLLFRFNAEGLIDTVSAETRGRAVGKEVVQTPWQGRFWNYQQRGGMLVPLHGEVAWVVDGAEQPYWRGEIIAIDYAFAPVPA